MDEIPHSMQHRMIGIDGAVDLRAQQLVSCKCVTSNRKQRRLLRYDRPGRGPALV